MQGCCRAGSRTEGEGDAQAPKLHVSAHVPFSSSSAAGREEFPTTGGLFATCLVPLLLGPPGDVATEGTWAWGLTPCSTEQLSWVSRQDLTSPEHHPVGMKPQLLHPPWSHRGPRGSGCCGGTLGTGQRGHPVPHHGEGDKIQGRQGWIWSRI